MNTITNQDIKVAFQTMLAVGDAVKAAGPGGIPSGHLYAMLTGGMSLTNYETIIRTLKNVGAVSETGHLLKWIGNETLTMLIERLTTNA